MNRLIYKLTFTTPLHISDIRADYGKSERRIHSDTIYSAVMQAWAMLGKSEWISQEPTFAISSLYPFATDINNNTIYFFPKPYVLPIKDENVNPELSKKFKKIQYIDKEHFEQLLKGLYNPTPECLKGEYLTKLKFKNNKNEYNNFNGTNKKYDELKIITSQVIPRIRWNRNESKDAEPFYMEKLYFSEGSGLWFMLISEDNDVISRFETALNLLSDEGLGTDRNVGNGKFTFEKDEINIDIPEGSDYCINLSLYCPKSNNELKNLLILNDDSDKIKIDPKIGYEIIKRGGWISEPYNTYRKKDLFMFSEGSVFRHTCNDIFTMGIVHDVTPGIVSNTTQNHKIYRSGYSIFIPIKVK